MSTEPRPRAGLRPRHVRRVTPEHAGQRVSLRRWVTDPERGPVQSDVVGRLVAWEPDDTLVVVDRDGAGVRVDAADVVSSRVVPEHPRLPAEPADAGSAASPLGEVVLRPLVLDAAERLLLRAPRRADAPWRAPGVLLPWRSDAPATLTAWARDALDVAAVEVGPEVLMRRSPRRHRDLWWETEERWCVLRLAGADAPDEPGAGRTWWPLASLVEQRPATDPDGLIDRLVSWRAHGTPSGPEPLAPAEDGAAGVDEPPATAT